MIRTETVTINERQFVHTYSDAGLFIERDGETYAEAYDPAEYAAERTYTETDELVDPPTEADYAEAGRIMLGVE